MYQKYIRGYLAEMYQISQLLYDDPNAISAIQKMAEIIEITRANKGRVFFIGVGGGAGTGSHATNDFNKIAGVSALCLSDNPSLFSALANDLGWESVFTEQMIMHRFNANDVLFVFSVNGGKPDISSNIVKAVDYAQDLGAKVLGVVGRDSGHVAKYGDAVCVIPIVDESRVTPHSETWQLAINHLLVNAVASAGEWKGE